MAFIPPYMGNVVNTLNLSEMAVSDPEKYVSVQEVVETASMPV